MFRRASTVVSILIGLALRLSVATTLHLKFRRLLSLADFSLTVFLGTLPVPFSILILFLSLQPCLAFVTECEVGAALAEGGQRVTDPTPALSLGLLLLKRLMLDPEI